MFDHALALHVEQRSGVVGFTAPLKTDPFTRPGPDEEDEGDSTRDHSQWTGVGICLHA